MGFYQFGARILLLPLCLALLAGCSRPSNRVVVYCALDREFSDPILEDFVQASGLEVVKRYDTEANKAIGLYEDLVREADRPRCDVHWNNEIIATIRRRFPNARAPKRDDICYATQNRQDAVKRICEEATLVLVVGSQTSSNANRLVEVARSRGAEAHLIDDENDLERAWLEGHETVGLTAGASSPDLLVERVVGRLAELGFDQREDVEIAREDVFFRLPPELR